MVVCGCFLVCGHTFVGGVVLVVVGVDGDGGVVVD